MFFQIASVFADHFGTAWIDVADPIFGETGIEAAIQTFLAKLFMVIFSLQGPTSKLVFGRLQFWPEIACSDVDKAKRM